MEDLLNRMKLDGWCVVEDVIPTDEVATVRAGVLTATEKHRNPHAPIEVTVTLLCSRFCER